jgi:plasmid stabilization system protein ParE
LHLIVRTDAEADIASGYGWYEEQQRGVGVEFLEEVSFTIAAIESQPLRFPQVSRTLRRALVRRFPYGIYFLIRDDEVVVVAVRHLARDPRRHRTARIGPQVVV